MSDHISNLDGCLDDLVVALQEVRDLEGLIVGLSGYEIALGLIPISNPIAVDALGVSRIWGAISAVASEILKLREVANGNAH